MLVKNNTIKHKFEPGASFHTIKKIHRHPKTKQRPKKFTQEGATWHYDIALVELNEPILFRKEAQPLMLAAPGDKATWNTSLVTNSILFC